MNFKARIAVFGGRDIDQEVYDDTFEIGKILARENYLQCQH